MKNMNPHVCFKWVYIALSAAFVLFIGKSNMPDSKEQTVQRSVERIAELHADSPDKSQLAKDVGTLKIVGQLPEAERMQGCASSTFYASGARSVCDDLVRTLSEPNKSSIAPLLAAFALFGLWIPLSWLFTGFFPRRQ